MKKMAKICAILGVILCVSISAHAETVTSKATGEGVTRKAAISEALYSAIEQATGVLIRNNSNSALELSQSDLSANNFTQTIHMMRESSQINLLKLTGGFVKSYKVDNVTTKDNVYKAEITAEIMLKPEAAKALTRRALVVGDFAPPTTQYYSNSFISFFAKSLASSLTQSQRFSVLDRSNDRALADEIQKMDDPRIGLAEWLNQQQTPLADYVVTGQVMGYNSELKQSKIAVTGEVNNWVEAQAQINYRVIALATREVKFSSTLNCRQKFTDNGNGALPTVNEADLLMAKSLATHIAAQITQGIYPYRVIKADFRDNLVINQGAATLKLGDELLLIQLGDTVEDPDTKEKIRTEREIGRVRITRVTSNLSIASIISGLEVINFGEAILRRVNETDECGAGADRAAQSGATGYGIGNNGQPRPVIKLPGD